MGLRRLIMTGGKRGEDDEYSMKYLLVRLLGEGQKISTNIIFSNSFDIDSISIYKYRGLIKFIHGLSTGIYLYSDLIKPSNKI